MKSDCYFHADDFRRLKEILKNILRCLLKGNLKSTSVMIGHITEYHHIKLKKIKNINMRTKYLKKLFNLIHLDTIKI